MGTTRDGLLDGKCFHPVFANGLGEYLASLHVGGCDVSPLDEQGDGGQLS